MNHHDEPVAPPLKAPASPPAVMGTSLRKPFSAPSCSASHVMAQAMMLESMRPSTVQTSPFSHFGSHRQCPGTAGMMVSGLCILSFLDAPPLISSGGHCRSLDRLTGTTAVHAKKPPPPRQAFPFGDAGFGPARENGEGLEKVSAKQGHAVHRRPAGGPGGVQRAL